MAKLTGTWKTVSEEIEGVLKKHGFTLGSLRALHYSGENRTKMTINVITGDQTKDYLRYCNMYYFKPEWLGINFLYGGKRYILKGFDMSKPKNRISMVCVEDDKVYMAPAIPVKLAIEREIALINAKKQA